MKNYSNIFRTMAALLMAGVAFSACTPDEEMLAKRTYTININASQGYNDAFKGLSEDQYSNILATWDENEHITVFNTTRTNDLEGYLTPETPGRKESQLSGNVTGTIANDDVLRLVRGRQNVNSQNGTLESIATQCDQAHSDLTVSSFNGSYIDFGVNQATFTNDQAIVKFSFRKKDGDKDPEPLTIRSLSIGTTYDITIASPTSTPYIALPGNTYSTTITAVEDGNDQEYTCTISNATLNNGQVYHITVNMTKKAN